MAGKNKKKSTSGNVIAVNRRASHDYFIEERYEAGLSLQGWEVKSLRAGKAVPLWCVTLLVPVPC